MSLQSVSSQSWCHNISPHQSCCKSPLYFIYSHYNGLQRSQKPSVWFMTMLTYQHILVEPSLAACSVSTWCVHNHGRFWSAVGQLASLLTTITLVIDKHTAKITFSSSWRSFYATTCVFGGNLKFWPYFTPLRIDWFINSIQWMISTAGELIRINGLTHKPVSTICVPPSL